MLVFEIVLDIKGGRDIVVAFVVLVVVVVVIVGREGVW